MNTDNDFKTASRCGIGACVAVKRDETKVQIRHSDGGPALTFDHAGWSAFIEGAKDGEFDI